MTPSLFTPLVSVSSHPIQSNPIQSNPIPPFFSALKPPLIGCGAVSAVCPHVLFNVQQSILASLLSTQIQSFSELTDLSQTLTYRVDGKS